MCDFTVAVNRRKTKNQQNPEADYFRVTVWNALAENCNKFLSKGKKVAVTGSVSLRTYTGNDGQNRASMEVRGDEVEFLSTRDGEGPKNAENGPENASTPEDSGFIPVETDDLPF